MPIVLITEALLQKSTVRDARILRDRMLSGFCVRMNARTRTFRVATSVAGQQFRLTLGHWPLISVDEARAQAMQVLRECRAGRLPAREIKKKLPTLAEALVAYCSAKGIKASSSKRYDSLMRTHFGQWLGRPVDASPRRGFFRALQRFCSEQGGLPWSRLPEGSGAL